MLLLGLLLLLGLMLLGVLPGQLAGPWHGAAARARAASARHPAQTPNRFALRSSWGSQFHHRACQPVSTYPGVLSDRIGRVVATNTRWYACLTLGSHALRVRGV
jgi:hypothetical protein